MFCCKYYLNFISIHLFVSQALTELQRELHESSSALQGICDTIVGSRDVRRRQYAAEQLTNCLDDMNEEGRKM